MAQLQPCPAGTTTPSLPGPPPPPSPHSHLSLDDLGVDFGHAVDGVGAHDAEMGHVDPLGVPLLDQGHPPQPVHVVGEQGRDVLPVEPERCSEVVALRDVPHHGNVPSASGTSQRVPFPSMDVSG